MNLKLNINFKTILPLLQRVQIYLFGIALVAIFAYTAFILNKAVNVTADSAVPTAATPAPKISFDKTTIDSLKDLNVVGGDVPLGSLGKDDPFK